MPNLLNPILAGQDLTSTFFNTTIDNARSVKYQKTDGVRNNTTTYLDSTDLTIAVLANAAYVFDSCFFYDSNTTADAKIRISLPAGSAALIASWGSTNTANTGTTNTITQQGLGPTANVIEFVLSGAGSGTVMSARPSGWIGISSTAGNIVIGHAQNTANASNTLLKQGSWIALTRVF